MTGDQSVHHPLFARWYARIAPAMERGIAEHRRDLLADLSGRVLEVGAGTGLNFRYYPATVTEVVAIEPEAYLRARATTAAATAPVTVTVTDGIAERLPAASDSFAAAVVSLVLCSVFDQDQALAELARVLQPGGELRFFEHVRAQTPAFARVQTLLDHVWPALGGGCHVSRDTVEHIKHAGFTIEQLHRFRLPDSRIPLPSSPIALGRARLS
jgi:ubiquinone/menaquinone biosynthesis C-methylase UbiE